MAKLFKVFFWAALATTIVGATIIIFNVYELHQKERYTQMAAAELEYFSISSEKRGGNLEDDMIRLLRAKALYAIAIEYGADPNNEINLDIEEKIQSRLEVISERAKNAQKKNPLKSFNKFWENFDKALDKYNKVSANKK